jgi:hypothetical protein
MGTDGASQTDAKPSNVTSEHTKGVGLGFNKTSSHGTEAMLNEVAKMKKKAQSERS